LSTKDFDPEFDGRFLPGYAPLFYAQSGGEKLTVNSMPGPEENMCIPFSFKKNAGDHFQINARITGEISTFVFLMDKKSGAVHNLTLEPVYAFTSEEDDPPDRFRISFSHAGPGETPLERIRVSFNGNNMLLDHQGNARVEIFNITGKSMVLRDLKGKGKEKVVLETPAGWYLVKVTAGDIAEVRKVFIHSSLH
jgi:hypothetical protein